MGQDVAARVFSRADRHRYREKVRVCLEVFARMLATSRFEPARGSFGLEIELNLTGDNPWSVRAWTCVLRDAPVDRSRLQAFRAHRWSWSVRASRRPLGMTGAFRRAAPLSAPELVDFLFAKAPRSYANSVPA